MVTICLSGAAILLLVYAALHDFIARTVPNWLPVCVLVIGGLARLVDHSLIPAVIVAAATFAILFIIWMLGAIGGGDVKLWAATAVLVPPRLQPELGFYFNVALIGGLLGLLYLGLSIFLRKRRIVNDRVVGARIVGAQTSVIRRHGGPREGGPRHDGPRHGGPVGLLRRALRVEAWRIGRRGPLPYAFAIAGSAIMTLLPYHIQH